MAKDVMINKIDLSQFIKQEFGISLPDLNTSLRLNHAEKLLVSTAEEYQGMAELAEKCGYDSLSTFYNDFKKRHNMTPIKWREQAIKEMEAKECS